MPNFFFTNQKQHSWSGNTIVISQQTIPYDIRLYQSKEHIADVGQLAKPLRGFNTILISHQSQSKMYHVIPFYIKHIADIGQLAMQLRGSRFERHFHKKQYQNKPKPKQIIWNQTISHLPISKSILLLMLGIWRSRWEARIPFSYHTKPNQTIWYQTKSYHTLLAHCGCWAAGNAAERFQYHFDIIPKLKQSQTKAKASFTKPNHVISFYIKAYCWCWAAGDAAERFVIPCTQRHLFSYNADFFLHSIFKSRVLSPCFCNFHNAKKRCGR